MPSKKDFVVNMESTPLLKTRSSSLSLGDLREDATNGSTNDGDQSFLRRKLVHKRNSTFAGEVMSNISSMVGQAPPSPTDDPEFRAELLASVDHGTEALGAFRIDPQALLPPATNDPATPDSIDPGYDATEESVVINPEDLPESFAEDAMLTPAEMGRKELYTEIPFTAIHGLQTKERAVTEAFAVYAAEVDAAAQDSKLDRTDSEKLLRAKQTTMIVQEEMTNEGSVVTLPLVIAVLVAAASQFIVGYNVAVMSAPERFVFPGHTSVSWAVAVSSFAIGGPFGALLGGSLADSRGRRGTLVIDMWMFFVGGLIQTFANSLTTVTLGRFIIGVASGISTVLVPVYLGEMAPPQLRGLIGTLNQFAAVVGVLVADLLAFPFANTWGWRYTFALTFFVACLQILAAPYVLESPRWLLSKDPKSDRARYILKQLRGLRKQEELESELATYMIGEAAQHTEKQSQSAVLREMLSDKPVRDLLFCCFALHVTQMFSGINGVFFYCGQLMSSFIENPLVGMTIIGTVNLISTYAALLLMDRCGRKTLLLWSAGGMFISCCVIVLAQLGYLSTICALIAVNTYVAFFEIGLGPIPWLYVAEMFDGKYVAAAMSICSQLNWVCNFIIGLIFPTLTATLGPYAFLPFAVVLALGFIFIGTILPSRDAIFQLEELVDDMHEHNAEIIVGYEPNMEEADDIDREWKKALDSKEHRRTSSVFSQPDPAEVVATPLESTSAV